MSEQKQFAAGILRVALSALKNLQENGGAKWNDEEKLDKAIELIDELLDSHLKNWELGE